MYLIFARDSISSKSFQPSVYDLWSIQPVSFLLAGCLLSLLLHLRMECAGEGPGQDIWWTRNKCLSLPIVRPRFVFLLFPPSNGSIAMLQISGDFQIQGLGVSFLLLSLALGVE